MTLLESIIALVILSLVAVGALGIFQQANRAAFDAQAWTVAASLAEQGMEAAKIGGRTVADVDSHSLPSGFTRRIDSKPGPIGLREVLVTVDLPGGGSVVAHRLVEPR